MNDVQDFHILRKTSDYIREKIKGSLVFGFPVFSNDAEIVAAYFLGQKNSKPSLEAEVKEDPTQNNLINNVRRDNPGWKILGCPHLENATGEYPRLSRSIYFGEDVSLWMCPNCSGLIVETILKEFTNRSVVIK